jgi:opacity protein-like surface antigen
MIRKFARVPGKFAVHTVFLLAAVLAGAITVCAQQAQPVLSQQDQTQQAQTQQIQAQQLQAQQLQAEQDPAQPAQSQPTQAQPDQSQKPQAQPSQLPQSQQPQTQQPQTQQTQHTEEQSSSQEISPEEIAARRKLKASQYLKWQFNVGVGADLTSGTTQKYARGGGPVAAVGVARNASRIIGLRLDFQFDNLPLRNTALQLAQATGATSHVYSLMLDPIISIPASDKWTGYVVFGPGFFHRSGKLDSSSTVAGAPCNAFWIWWGRCYAGSLPANGDFLSASQNEFGYNVGAGVARKVRSNMEIYAEFRFIHGTSVHITTDTRPITIGVRW